MRRCSFALSALFFLRSIPSPLSLQTWFAFGAGFSVSQNELTSLMVLFGRASARLPRHLVSKNSKRYFCGFLSRTILSEQKYKRVGAFSTSRYLQPRRKISLPFDAHLCANRLDHSALHFIETNYSLCAPRIPRTFSARFLGLRAIWYLARETTS